MVIRIISIYLFLCSFNAYSQMSNEEITNFVLFVDGELIEGSSLNNELVIIVDESIFLRDTIIVNYQIGRLSTKQSVNFQDYDKESKVIIRFNYSQGYPDRAKYTYEVVTSLSWLLQDYFILKVYNYENKVNRKHFKEKKGYGVEIKIPAHETMLPRKSKWRN